MIWSDEDIKKLATAVCDEMERRETEERRLNEEYRAEFWKLLKEFNKNENPFPDRREEGKGKIMCKDCGEWLKDAKSGLPVFLNQADQMMYVAGKLELPPVACLCEDKKPWNFITEYMNTHDTEGRPLQTDTKMKFSFPMSIPLDEDGDFRESIIRRIFRGALK